MKKHMGSLVIATASIVLCGCGNVNLLGTIDPATAGVRVDSTLYHVMTTVESHEVSIEVSFTNPLTQEVQIPTCHSPHPPVLEKRQGDTWVIAHTSVVLLCLGPPVRIQPGEQYTMRYHIYGARRQNAYPKFDVEEIPGVYRLDWRALQTRSERPIPLRYRVSEPFELAEIQQ